MMWLWPSARALLAYMSEASLKKGPAWGLSTTLDAGRLYAGRFSCGSSITLIIYAIVKTPGGKWCEGGEWKRGEVHGSSPQERDFSLILGRTACRMWLCLNFCFHSCSVRSYRCFFLQCKDKMKFLDNQMLLQKVFWLTKFRLICCKITC